MSSFNYFPKIKYNNLTSVNLLSKISLIREYNNSYDKFYTYLVKDGERADIIAYNQYNDASLDWVIYIINEMIDPYSSWVMTNSNFISYIEDKYGVSAARLNSVIIEESIHHYYYKGIASDTQEIISSYNYTMTKETYDKLGNPSGWVPKSIFDYEDEMNESKRTIKLLRSNYINEFKTQFKDLING
jgi:hypothetical protein